MIEVEGLRKVYGDRVAVDGVSFRVEPGQIFGLLGPNGAGKSTTIRMIVDIIHPDQGAVTFDGAGIAENIRSKIGYLPEERGLYQKARILETIVHFGRLKGMDATAATEQAMVWLERFGLADSGMRQVEELSKGNQQKVQIIIALLHDPEYVILDEPTSGLDPVNQGILRDIVVDLRTRGKAILYSTHQMDLAERLCDRIALVDHGSLVLSGSVEEVRGGSRGDDIVLEFDGEGAFLASIPWVEQSSIEGNRAELHVAKGYGLPDLFAEIGDRLHLSRIERVRPSLNTIFLEAVGATTSTTTSNTEAA